MLSCSFDDTFSTLYIRQTVLDGGERERRREKKKEIERERERERERENRREIERESPRARERGRKSQREREKDRSRPLSPVIFAQLTPGSLLLYWKWTYEVYQLNKYICSLT